MKKLIISAAIVCAAIISQAAQFSWGFSSDSCLDPAGEYLEGATASLFIGETLVVSGGMNDDYTYGVLDNSASDSTGSVQSLSDGDVSGSFVGQAYKLVLNYTDGDGKAWMATYSDTSAYSTVAGAPGELAKNYEMFMTGYAVQASDWQSVPEPTSGLLLLLGVAGLALRRRRA